MTSVMHECDKDCPDDCDLTDYSESACRKHDEHNFDVREVIHERAEGLVGALEEWLNPAEQETGGTNRNRAGRSRQ